MTKNGLFLFFKKRSKIYRQKGRRANVKMKELFNDKSIVGSPVMHYLKLVVLLMVIWLMLSGKLEAKFLIYGLVTSLVSAWICMPLLTVNGINGDKKYFAFGFPVFKMIAYCFWLLWQLILANIDVAKAIVSPELVIDPKVIRFKVAMDNPLALTILANSITLTPGTVTMNVTDDGIYEVHALTEGAAEGLLGGDMQRKVARLFKQDESVIVMEEVAV